MKWDAGGSEVWDTVRIRNDTDNDTSAIMCGPAQRHHLAEVFVEGGRQIHMA